MLRHLLPAILLAGSVPAGAAVPPSTSWYWQLDGAVNTTRAASVYDIDMEGATAALVASLKASGHTVVCYITVGDWEDYRADASAFPASVIGKNVQGWPGEKYTDIRSPVVQSIIAKRLDAAKAKGCDAIEPDLDDTYTASTGFPLTKAIQITYDTWVAAQVHQRGMLVALKNATDLAAGFAPLFDFAIVEQCFQYHECPKYSAFVAQGKAVLEAEYRTYSSSICAQAKALSFSTAFYGVALNGKKYAPCP